MLLAEVAADVQSEPLEGDRSLDKSYGKQGCVSTGLHHCVGEKNKKTVFETDPH